MSGVFPWHHHGSHARIDQSCLMLMRFLTGSRLSPPPPAAVVTGLLRPSEVLQCLLVPGPDAARMSLTICLSFGIHQQPLSEPQVTYRGLYDFLCLTQLKEDRKEMMGRAPKEWLQHPFTSVHNHLAAF